VGQNRLVLAVTANAGSGAMYALAHPTPLVVLTSGSNVDLYNLACGSVGEVVVVLRTGYGGQIKVYHNNFGGGGCGIIVPRGFEPTIGNRAGMQFVFDGGVWLMSYYSR
jgi:hypothetical protein